MYFFFIILFTTIITRNHGNPIDDKFKFPNSDYFQGDIKLKTDESGRTGQLGLTNTRYRWPKDAQGLVVIPFTIRSSSGYSQSEINNIIAGQDEIMRLTCVRFVPRTNQADYVEYFSGDGCWSYVGKTGGRQDLSLARGGCTGKGTVIHETVHAIGFTHMQNAFDRDNYIRVAWENMNPRDYPAFDKVDPKDWSHFGTIYDYKSIMHYEARTFSINGKDVMIPYDSRFIGKLGGGSNLSPGDATRIRNMYGC